VGHNRDWHRQKLAKDKRLGKLFDTELAEIYGVSGSFVSRVRSELGIPPAPRKIVRRYHPMRDMIVKDDLLGMVPDHLLARKYDCSRHLVMAIRRENNIPPSQPASNENPGVAYIPTWQTALLDKWYRPAGLDSHLEYLHANAKEI